MMWVFFLILIIVTGAGAWQMYKLQQTLMATQSELLQTKSSLNKVTGDVSAAGATISQSDSTFRSELKTVDSEIRKLWDVSNKRNRRWINDNKANIVNNAKKLDSISVDATKAMDLAQQGRDNTTKIQSRLAEVEQLIKAVTTEHLVANTDLAANMEKLHQEMDRLEGLFAEQQRIESIISDYVTRQQTLNNSFSSFRTQTNQRIQQLENSVRDLAKFNAPQTQELSSIQ